MATNLSLDRGRQLLIDDTSEITSNSFSLVKLIARAAADPDTEEAARDLLIRAINRREQFDPATRELLDSLTSRLGLFPYISQPGSLAAGEQIAFEFHRPRMLVPGEFVFHGEQRRIYDMLVSGQNVLLSAPTSFGKSAIVDALISSERWRTIVIIVPTIALIDETRRRITSLNSNYKVVTHPSQQSSSMTIYVLTQERFLELPEQPQVDLFVIDEFYKLDSDPEESRTVYLNVAWDRLRRSGAQYYLIGPNIDALSNELPQYLSDQLYVTRFRTVAVDETIIDEQPSQETLVRLCSGLSGPTLIYVRSPERAYEVGQWLLEAGVGSTSQGTELAANWIGKNFHQDWILGRCLRQGIGLHHGRVPRALQHHILRHFNQGEVDFLICTSTLIEGVNTVAENVVVFDKTLNRRTLDYFTFSNIRGRAGRMFKHFIGHVYSFMPTPPQSQQIVDIPITSQSKRASESTLLQIPQRDLSPGSATRLRELERQSSLSLDILRQNRGIDPKRQIALANEIRESSRYFHTLLSWRGAPNYGQRVATCDLIMRHFGRPGGPATAESVAVRLESARRFESSVSRLTLDQLRFSESVDVAVDEVLRFLRNWVNFTFPNYLKALDTIQAAVFSEIGLPSGDYRFYAGQSESLFLPQFFAMLEEYGLPYQVALKMRSMGLAGESLDDVLQTLRAIGYARVSETELERYEIEMLNDVLIGLG